jgi:hypothetical protein
MDTNGSGAGAKARRRVARAGLDVEALVAAAARFCEGPVGEVFRIGTLSVGSASNTRRRFKSAATGKDCPARSGLFTGGVAGAAGAVCGAAKKETKAATALDFVLRRFTSVDGDSCDSRNKSSATARTNEIHSDQSRGTAVSLSRSKQARTKVHKNAESPAVSISDEGQVEARKTERKCVVAGLNASKSTVGGTTTVTDFLDGQSWSARTT